MQQGQQQQQQQQQQAPQPHGPTSSLAGVAAGQTERPYRSHLRPACVPCRRRKSRCQTEANSVVCVTCRAHRTECYFPDSPRSHQTAGGEAANRRVRRTAHSRPSNAAAPARIPSTVAGESTSTTRAVATTSAIRSSRPTGNASATPAGFKPAQQRHPIPSHDPLQSAAVSAPGMSHTRVTNSEDPPMALGSSADDINVNLHIVGPTDTNDSQFLSEYLATIPEAMRSTRMVVPQSAGRSKPVLFTMVQKRPVGIKLNRSPSAEKLEMIEKLLEPYTATLIDEFFAKANDCLPLLDEDSFRHQYQEGKDRVSPALLACLYANAIVYWKHSARLSQHRCPDSRFVWNLANEALYSELHLSPGMPIIKAILLNIGGRPTTSLIGNGVLLGSAVSMAHSLGLNHNPLPWSIPQSEKNLRMKLWWALLLHDRWMSLAHGTPPRISRDQHDIPMPLLEHLCDPGAPEKRVRAATVFIALYGLTDVLDRHLQHVYCAGRDTSWDTSKLELSLNSWVESLTGSTRLTILRGSHLDIPGAANLRLAYLTTRLLLQRIQLESDKHSYSADNQHLLNRYIQARRTSEEILLLVQELQPQHLGDFWLSVSAFAFPATVNFLLRCALESESSLAGLAQSTSFRIARDLVATLQSHQEKHSWDLADVCLAQHAEVVDKMLRGIAPDDQGGRSSGSLDEWPTPDASLIDQIFPSLWDSMQNVW